MILFSFIIGFSAQGEEIAHVTAIAQNGDRIIDLLQRYGLSDHHNNYFLSLNGLQKDSKLQAGKAYQLPVRIYPYNDQSIASSLDLSFKEALSIQKYNETVHQSGLKRQVWNDKIVWRPYDNLFSEPVKTIPKKIEKAKSPKRANQNKNYSVNCPIFGAKYSDVQVESNMLANCVYYLVSGHGGPDPGAIGERESNQLCEDEYAYDVSLRLARELVKYGATVYIIIQDPNDGIRDEKFLQPDDDEICIGNRAIPHERNQRLKQRVKVVNRLFRKYKDTHYQRLISIHVDSRQDESKRVEIDFYHYPLSSLGGRLAENLYRTVEAKYAHFQPDRGYAGRVIPKNFYMLCETLPVSLLIELGSIRNEFDQVRLIEADNRQAIAKWLCEGLIEDRISGAGSRLAEN